MITSQNGNIEVLDTLIKHGANVDLKKEVNLYNLYNIIIIRKYKLNQAYLVCDGSGGWRNGGRREGRLWLVRVSATFLLT